MALKIHQKGVAVYLALVVTAVILAIALGLSVILIGQIKIARGISNSVVALYAADSGIEKILYEESLCRTKDASGDCILGGVGSNCFGECQGLAEDRTFSLDTPMIYKADYAIDQDETTGEWVMRLKSVGDYKNTKRAIETTVPVPLMSIVIDCSTLNCGDPSQVDWVFVNNAFGVKVHGATFNVRYATSGNRDRALFKWNLGAKIPSGSLIDSATLHFCETTSMVVESANIQLFSVADANDGWSSSGTSWQDLYGLPTDLVIETYIALLLQGECKSVDITSQVEREFESGGNGILSLKWQAPGPTANDYYASPNYSDPAYQPYIEITYTRR